jgi:muramoyltetrapeptide carboxypeptidase
MIETPAARPAAVSPETLKEGDLVALVAPSGPVPPQRAASAVDVLVGWGLRVRMGAYALGKHAFFAGTDEERLDDLNAALRDEEVRGVLCLRGGYGMQRIIHGVDFAAVARDPKLVMGFSDITALHAALWCEAGLATVHGPVAAQFDKGATSPTALGAYKALMTSEDITVHADGNEGTFRVRTSGRAEGVLVGGNLAILASTVGTRHALDLANAILLIEDVNEEPYRIDRMLTHLLRAGWLDSVQGIAVGQFTDCVDEGRTTVEDVLTERLAALGVPVLGGLPIGHGEQQTAVGLGVPAVLDADAGTLVVRAVGR